MTTTPVRRTSLTPSRLFRIVAVAEAVTWALLLAGMLQKYVLDAGGWGVSIGGALHGFVFLAYCAVAAIVAVNQRWRAGVTVVALTSAVVPFVTIWTEIAFARAGRLAGGWRTHESDDPRDRRLVDRVVRWWIARPALLATVVALAVIVVFGTLLIVGPPGGRDA